MAYLILTRDVADGASIRDRHRARHYEFLERHAARLLASGGLADEAGEGFIGAAIMLDCATRAEAEAFVREDPFYAAGLFRSVEIIAWRAAYLAGRRVVVSPPPRS